MAVRERLKEFIKLIGIGQKAFAQSVGLSDGYVNAISKSIQPDTLHRISMQYPTLNIEWLITGVGEMLKNSDPEKPKPNLDGVGVPYYNVDFINGYDVIMNDQTVNPEFFINFPLYNNATCWVNASGKSMEPLITPGDIIAIRKLNDWQTYLLPGEVYAIVTTEYRTIKRILEKDADTLILVPENPDFGRKEIPKSIVLEVFQVLGCVKKVI